jgi:co-chaperonin GroES (HSP10)
MTNFKQMTLADFDLASLPQPTGYHILVAIPQMEEKVGKSGLILAPEGYKKDEEGASNAGLVLALGPDAYKDTVRFPSGAWVKPGDWVYIKSYSGARFKAGDREFRIINDDAPEGVMRDPNAIQRSWGK